MQVLEKILAKRWMIFLLFLSLTYLFVTKTDRRYGWTNKDAKEATAIYSDAAGYYAFLPNWFIYEGNKFGFNDSIRLKYPDAGFEDALTKNKDGTLHDKYFTGTAQCLTPFFLMGHAHANIVGEDTDGYTWPYLLWLNAGTIFYSMIGLISLFLFLRRLKLSYFSCYVSVILLAVATTLSFYTYFDIPYSHVFSFATVNLCLLQGLKWVQENKKRNLIFFAFFLGLSFMIRPTNFLILLILPFLFNSNKELWERLKTLFTKEWKFLLLSLLVFGIPVVIQVYSFYLQMGEIRLNSYSNEGFDHWKSPYILDILFGFRKGMFVYSPVLLLFFPGLVFMYLKNKRVFFGVLAFGIISTYVLASWWCWWYGGSLGFRPMVDFYGVFVIPIAFLIHYTSWFWRIFILAFIVFTTHVYQVYEYQYKKHIIHYDYMNYPMWKHVFLKQDDRYSFMFYSKIDSIPGNSKPVGGLMGFSVGKTPLQDGKIYGGGSKFLYPNRVDFAKRLTGSEFESLTHSSDYLGLRFSMDLYIKGGGDNASIAAEYFKEGSFLGKSEFIVSSRLKSTEEWEFVTVDVAPAYRWKDIDSMRCSLILGQETIRFKNLKIRFFKYH
ncbi:MAG: hypothetical protein ACO1N0_07265 [Fluviicola sp.]